MPVMLTSIPVHQLLLLMLMVILSWQLDLPLVLTVEDLSVGEDLVVTNSVPQVNPITTPMELRVIEMTSVDFVVNSTYVSNVVALDINPINVPMRVLGHSNSTTPHSF